MLRTSQLSIKCVQLQQERECVPQFTAVWLHGQRVIFSLTGIINLQPEIVTILPYHHDHRYIYMEELNVQVNNQTNLTRFHCRKGNYKTSTF